MTAQKLKYKHGKAFKVLFRIVQLFLLGVFRLLYRLSIKCVDKVPREGKYIVCSNHISYLDPVVIGASIPRIIYFMAKRELFSLMFISNLVTFFNAFPVNRNSFDRKPIERSLKVLQNGNLLGLFPEGSRSVDGIIREGKRGVGLLSILSGAKIIPVAISGTNNIIQKPHKRIFFPKIKLIIGDIIDTEKIIAENSRKDAASIIVSETMESIKRLHALII
jgi:1-acyl-sn-glycerol-3-phosphate acyltransferase